MRHNEQAVADIFNSFFARTAKSNGYIGQALALGGQDVIAAADTLLTDTSNFAFVEFKFGPEQLRDEVRKPRRLKLCKLLKTNPQMRAFHEQCHFVVWNDPEQGIVCNTYRNEICNREIFKTEAELPEHPTTSTRVLAGAFTQQFFDGQPPRHLGLDDFEAYVRWLLQDTSGSMESTLELIVQDTNAEQLVLLRMGSVRELYDWMQRKPSPSFRP